MKKYKNFNQIGKQDIQEFRGLEADIKFTPYSEMDINPLTISCFGITYPNKDYYIKRNPSPCFILEYIVSGSGYLEINDEKYKLEAGDAYIIHPGDFCEYYADEKNPYKKYWINFNCMFFFNELLKAYDINDRVMHNLDLSQYFEEIFKLENFSDLNDELYIPISKILFNIMMDFALSKQKEINIKKRDLAYAVKYRLNRCVTTPITIEDLSKKLYHSKNDIIRQFKKKYKITPYSYLIEIRIRHAKNLLINTKKNLAEIASHLCFSSEYHFSNTFKKKVGVSPKEYRKREALSNKPKD